MLIRPPTKALLPNVPYKNNRKVLHGAIDSVTNLFLIPSSRPPFFLLFPLSLLFMDKYEVCFLVVNSDDGVFIADGDVVVVQMFWLAEVEKAFPVEQQQHNRTATITRPDVRSMGGLIEEEVDDMIVVGHDFSLCVCVWLCACLLQQQTVLDGDQ